MASEYTKRDMLSLVEPEILYTKPNLRIQLATVEIGVLGNFIW